jgi:hypothetical protein
MELQNWEAVAEEALLNVQLMLEGNCYGVYS